LIPAKPVLNSFPSTSLGHVSKVFLFSFIILEHLQSLFTFCSPHPTPKPVGCVSFSRLSPALPLLSLPQHGLPSTPSLSLFLCGDHSILSQPREGGLSDFLSGQPDTALFCLKQRGSQLQEGRAPPTHTHLHSDQHTTHSQPSSLIYSHSHMHSITHVHTHTHTSSHLEQPYSQRIHSEERGQPAKVGRQLQGPPCCPARGLLDVHPAPLSSRYGPYDSSCAPLEKPAWCLAT
jgi:hypothetical protein